MGFQTLHIGLPDGFDTRDQQFVLAFQPFELDPAVERQGFLGGIEDLDQMSA